VQVLVAEDDRDIGELIARYVQRNGWTVRLATSGTEALAYAREHSIDLLILDLMLPGMSGLEVCRALRGDPRTAAIPIIMVTAKAEETDAVIGLGVGADDYVRKPFGLRELVARVRSLLRRSAEPPEAGQPIRVGDLEVDPARHEVRLRGEPIPLTATEFRLLHHLVRNPGRVYSRVQLLDKAVGTDVIVIERNVDVHISALRRKLQDYGDRIMTIRGVGYKFTE
jgi:two-component system phosphate regulon response regulator PhoB